jgi:hypothetical protein
MHNLFLYSICIKSVQTLVRDTLVFKKDHRTLRQSVHAT